MKDIRKNPLVKKLLSLNLPKDDYAIFGSAPLFFHEIIDELRDLDIVARENAWEKAKKLGKAKKAPLGNYSIKLFNGKIEIVNNWVPGDWDIDKLIEEADIVNGIRVVDLEKVYNWKKKMGREKDKKHIKLIEESGKNKTKSS